MTALHPFSAPAGRDRHPSGASRLMPDLLSDGFDGTLLRLARMDGRKVKSKKGFRVLSVRSSASKNKALQRVLRRCLDLEKLQHSWGFRAGFKTSRSHFSLSPDRTGRSSGGATSSARSVFRAGVPPLEPSPAGGALLHPLGRHAGGRLAHRFPMARDLRKSHLAKSSVRRSVGIFPKKGASGMDVRILLVPPPAPA